MAKILSYLLLACLAYGQDSGQNLEYKMQQVSVWIEHRYATAEIGIWLKNTDNVTSTQPCQTTNDPSRECLTEPLTVLLSYDLKRSDYIHDLHAEVGNERYTGKVMERKLADQRCDDANANGKICVKVETNNVEPKDINNFRKFNYEVRIPAGQELKVWLRYSSIIFMQDEKLTYELNNYLQNFNGVKPDREVFQVYINEVEKLKGVPKITCNQRNVVTKEVTLPGIPEIGNPRPWEYFGVFDSPNGSPGLCEEGGRASCPRPHCRTRGRRATNRIEKHKIKIEYEVERQKIMKIIKGRV